MLAPGGSCVVVVGSVLLACAASSLARDDDDDGSALTNDSSESEIAIAPTDMSSFSADFGDVLERGEREPSAAGPQGLVSLSPKAL